ncbi:putative lipoprotein [Acidovorax sp. KKS102]|nr:putative lipoprotein [Acidovorax sp. KKS102]
MRFPWSTEFHASPPTLLRAAAVALACGATLVMAGCTSTGVKTFGVQENFGSVATYSRLFDATPAQTCEASRRALLSQGYVISSSSADLVEGKKSFQPEPESHLQMVVRVVCVPEANDGKVSLGFVTATQDTYALRKTNNSASVGVGAIGSVSLPFSSSSESLVKVGSETIAKDTFYDSFFDLVKRYLVIDQALAD